ncbi:MAG: nucleoside deaminase [Candidatus Cloacimonetes bacterium]|jgi:tRNA(adenine34) deaminase|nr:nucleoside deaminase [Candidatus Cloacimonadota bacterium]
MKKYPDEYWMQLAIDEARSALQENEVPIGALLVKNNRLIVSAHNRTNKTNSTLAHAEKLVIEEVVANGEKFLNDYTLYVTVEPCLMCAGTIIWSRVGRVVFGCFDKKAGAAGSIYNALLDKNMNHNPELASGVCEEECSNLIKNFFRSKRK